MRLPPLSALAALLHLSASGMHRPPANSGLLKPTIYSPSLSNGRPGRVPAGENCLESHDHQTADEGVQ
jgi:hypothetical protein